MRIRRAENADAAGIAAVHVAAWKEAYAGIVPEEFLAELAPARRERIWREQLSQAASESGVFVAESDDQSIVGFAQGGPTRWAELPASGELYAIYLLRAYQKMGDGRELFQEVVAELKARGLSSMMCWVLRDGPAVGFYEHMGGRRRAEKEIVIGGHALIEIAMIWESI